MEKGEERKRGDGRKREEEVRIDIEGERKRERKRLLPHWIRCRFTSLMVTMEIIIEQPHRPRKRVERGFGGEERRLAEKEREGEERYMKRGVERNNATKERGGV